MYIYMHICIYIVSHSTATGPSSQTKHADSIVFFGFVSAAV